MSGVLTITTYYDPSRDSQRPATVTQVGGTGEPDVTERVLHETDMFGRVSVTKSVYGESGDDVLLGDSITQQLNGGVGNDTLTSVGGSSLSWLIGGDGDDWLRGSASDDLLEAGSGNDTIDGGAGFDLVGFGGASGVTVDLGVSGPQQTGEGLDVLTGVEAVKGTDFGDTLTGDASANQLLGGAGSDVIYGLGGNDTITDEGYYTDDWGFRHDGPTADYLRGGDGDDSISGGEEFDDLNGNAGNDTINGDDGDDWVVGGKDQDLLFGDEGADIVLGNLGNDTAAGGEGADTVRGGQGDDSLAGGGEDDWLSGDLGNDTISGGGGADVFHSFGAAGIDQVLDFTYEGGDRVLLDSGTRYTATQSGADTVISMAGGAQMTLVGVQLASLPSDWIFSG